MSYSVEIFYSLRLVSVHTQVLDILFRITWRRLTKVDRDYEFENIIVNFMKESISTSFDISARIFLAQ
jgi:hypothetical protein